MADAPTMSEHFADPGAVADYAARTRRAVAGLDVLHALVDQLLAASVPEDGRVLIVGAGGGLELAHLASRHPGWQLHGVDPSAEMLGVAATAVGDDLGRVTLQEGFVDAAPAGPYDGATCLLVLHFVRADERLAMLREIHRRLRPGAALLTFHHSVPAGDEGRRWLVRQARFVAGPQAPEAQVQRSAEQLHTRLEFLTPVEEVELLREAGFRAPELFYSALSLRGWLATA